MSETDLMSTEKPYLSDAIHYPTDIEPHPFVCLWAGVGSGKNTFIENMINGCPKKEIPRLTILLITSRKAKVLETLRKYPENTFGRLYDENNYLDILYDAPLSTKEYQHTITIDGLDYLITQRSAIFTNTAIEKYHQYCYDPSDPCTYLWNRFDLIVWDEAHSLIMDSSYQSAPYHVMRMFQQTYKMMRQAADGKAAPPYCKNLIMMTGTPDPLAGITMIKNAHHLDLLDTCRSVFPRNIHFLTQQQAQQNIRQQLQSGERIVYFSNHVPDAGKLCKTYQIAKERIAISFSDKKRRENLQKQFETQEKGSDSQSENDYPRMIRVENHLAEHASIPADIDLFVTTSRNKEGININDEDIHHVYTESHSITDIKQMAGRIRNGVEHLYIILDAPKLGSADGPFESYISEQVSQSSITAHGPVESQLNHNLKEFCRWQKISDLSSIRAYDSAHPKLSSYIDQIKKKYPYVEFDYFSNEFRFNTYRKDSLNYYANELQMFDDAIADPAQLNALFQKSFPHSKIHAYISPIDQGRTYVLRYLELHTEKYHPYDEIVLIAKHLRKLIGAPKRIKSSEDKLTNPNHYLRQVGFCYKRRNKNSAHPNYLFCSLDPDPDTSSQPFDAA